MKRTLSVLMTALLMVALLPCAQAEEEQAILESDGFRYVVLDDGSVEITGWLVIGWLNSIPSTLDGKKVTRIGDYAFYDSWWIETITIPDSVTSIGDRAFGECHRLTSVTIPDSVSEMGANPFNESAHIIVSPKNPYFATIDGVLYEKATKKLVSFTNNFYEFTIPEGIAAIGDYAFYHTCIQDVTIPSSVTSIGDYAFCECNGLTSVTISNGVKSIGDCAFYHCTLLPAITIPDSVTSIGDLAFCDNRYMTSITIPDSVSKIGVNPFYLCEKLTSINVSPTQPHFTTIDGVLYEKATNKLVCYPYAFKAKEFIIPQGTAIIGDYAFADSSLNTVTIPDSVISIGDYAFYSSRLTNITIPNSVTSIGQSAFFQCRSLSTVTILDDVTFIGEDAFSVTNIYDKKYGNPGISFIISYGGYVDAYCRENGLNYTYQSSDDWLNN